VGAFTLEWGGMRKGAGFDRERCYNVLFVRLFIKVLKDDQYSMKLLRRGQTV